ncbi:12614_t:CDS:2 [Ambispora leptoticha]|uniref:12614_t:CDS:1 n=1 Tax=Ambispora leptoticha TaxID=144679 RepID=A0A9N9AUA6_9GLOM|nr:12614_t:CDS:2 [Ambispora leptoticha]
MADQTAHSVVDPNAAPVTPNASGSNAAASSATHLSGQHSQQLQAQNQQFSSQFWNQQLITAQNFESDFKNHPLPLARIKKVMKSDQDVKMISAEAPILFSKACEIFISEITMRAWIHAEENKRRTLQRSDVASAVGRSDQFDFLIDIVPREEVSKVARRPKEEAQQPEQMYDQNVLAYYQGPAGVQYPAVSDPSSYYPSRDQEQQLSQHLRQPPPPSSPLQHQELLYQNHQSKEINTTAISQENTQAHFLHLSESIGNYTIATKSSSSLVCSSPTTTPQLSRQIITESSSNSIEDLPSSSMLK